MYKKYSENVFVRYVNHASFLITYKKTSLLIDPFFSGRFFWQNHYEIQVSKPKITLEELPEIDAILCTHIHGDHFDLSSILHLFRRDNCLVIVPFDAVELCIKAGIDKTRCLVMEIKKSVQVKDANIVFLPNKGSENEMCNRFSLVIECGSKRIFHSGDSHGYSEMWNEYRRKITLACLWCVKTEEIIEFLQPEAVVLQHFERFLPGDFSCNIEVSNLTNELKKKFNNINFFNPLKEDTIVLQNHKEE